ncbi:MAG: insulinase family protein, partial [Firmicutes bacterium]|nr:insulinase family protein [Bacillota bacterium]
MIIKKTVKGVSCYIVPKKGFVQKQAMAVVRFGSDTAGFNTQNGHTDIPAGTAHFMEHLMFASPQGNLMDKFSALGAEANAFTAFDKTAYYFTCTDNFYESLEVLVNMVFTRHFTKENIDGERKIITEEINMYKDDARWQCYFSLLKCLYPDTAIANEIAGSVKDIKNIDENLLCTCFDNFYIPENIAFIAAGDIDIDKFCETVEKNTPNPCKKTAERDMPENTIKGKNYAENRMDISTPFFYVGFKEKNTPISAESIVKMRIILECAAGECSALYARLLNEGLAEVPLGFEYLKGSYYGAGLLFGESTKPRKTAEYILTELENAAENGLKNA